MDKSQENAQFVMRNKKAEQPHVTSEGLQVWYDVKGKKDTDYYKDTLIDLSGNGRDATLHNFAYEKRSGYLDDKDGGLIFDDVDDKLVYPSVKGEVEYTSASKNQLPPFSSGLWSLYGGATISGNTLTIPREGAFATIDMPWDRSDTKIRVSALYSAPPLINIRYFDDERSQIGGNGWTNASVDPIDRAYGVLPYSESQGDLTKIKTIRVQLTTGSTTPTLPYTVTDMMLTANSHGNIPYTPYVPLPVMTYQYNGNILSYEADGTVKRVDDGKVITRKGINLVRNGNFADGVKNFSPSNSKIEAIDGVLRITGDGSATIPRALQPLPFSLGKYYVSAIVKVLNDDCKSLKLYGGGNSVDIKTLSNPIENQTYILDGVMNLTDSNLLPSSVFIRADYQTKELALGKTIEVGSIQVIDLTEAYGAGNEPTLEYIQAHPEEFAWTPNPNDLIEAHEIKNNLVGDLEDLHGTGDKTEFLSGTEIFTDKADDNSVVHVEIDGKSYQHVDESNLFDIQGWLSTPDSEKPASNGVPCIDIELKPNTKYTVSTNIPDRGSLYDVFSMASNSSASSGTNGVSINITRTTQTLSDGILRIAMRDYSLDKNSDYWIKVEEGTTATQFNGYSAPIPDYPTEIHSLNDFDVVSSVERENLIPSRVLQPSQATTTKEFTLSSWAQVLIDAQDTAKILEVGETYTLSYEAELVERTTAPTLFSLQAGILLYSQTGSGRSFYSGIKEVGDKDKVSVTFVCPPLDSNHRFLVYTNRYTTNGSSPIGTDTINFKNFKLEKGSTATHYSPSPEDITEDNNHPLINKINLLLSEPLRSVGDVKDRLFRDSDGLWKIERNVNEHIFTGSESFGANVTYGAYYVTGDSLHNESIVGAKSNYLRSSSGWSLLNGEKNAVGLAPNTRAVRMSIVIDGVQLTNSTIKLWLTQKYNSGNPLIIQYLVETPTIETLDQELQDKLNNIATYAGSNYVYTVVDKTELSPTVAENLQPTLHAKFRKLSWFWSRLLFNQLKIWNFPLSDSQLLHEYKMNKRRWGM